MCTTNDTVTYVDNVMNIDVSWTLTCHVVMLNTIMFALWKRSSMDDDRAVKGDWQTEGRSVQDNPLMTVTPDKQLVPIQVRLLRMEAKGFRRKKEKENHTFFSPTNCTIIYVFRQLKGKRTGWKLWGRDNEKVWI